MPTTILPNIPDVPGDASIKQKAFFSTIKEIIEVRNNRRGDSQDRFVTYRELQSLILDSPTMSAYLTAGHNHPHDSASGILGGSTGQHYHLTSTEYTGTGTGAFVRATSPTLVTPTLGVATATGLGIGVAPSYPLHIVDSITESADQYACFITVTPGGAVSGPVGGPGNVIHAALGIDVESSFEGTQVSGYRQTLRGLTITVDTTGDGQFWVENAINAEALHSADTPFTTQTGIRLTAQNLGDGSGATGVGLSGYYLNGGAGTITNATGTLFGVLQTGASGTITTGKAVSAYVTQSAGTLETGYLFYGAFTGTVGTKWGIYLSGETNNYLSGSLLIGTASSLTTLTQGLVLGAGTAPTAVLANGVGLWCEDIAGGAGKAGLHMMSESGTDKQVVAGVIIKTDTGDPSQVHEGLLEINTYDNKVKMYADGAWRELGTWT